MQRDYVRRLNKLVLQLYGRAGQGRKLGGRVRGQIWQKRKKTNLPVIVIEDKQYLLDYSDITGIEWREIKKLTGLNSMEAIAQTSMMDFESLASIVYIFAKREDKNVKYEEILGKLTIESIKNEEIWIKISQSLRARYRKHLPALAHFFGIQAWELERLSIGEINVSHTTR